MNEDFNILMEQAIEKLEQYSTRLSQNEVAEVLGYSASTLATWRSRGSGYGDKNALHFIKIGGFPQYRPEDVLKWINENREKFMNFQKGKYKIYSDTRREYERKK